jgi:hypothetical protein
MLKHMVRTAVVLVSILVLLVGAGLAQQKTTEELVNFKQLLPFVNLKLPGWELQGEPEGSTVKSSMMKMSEAKADYKSGDKSLEVTIVDGSMAKMAFMGMGLMKGVEVQTSKETTRTTKVQGFEAVETFKHKDKDGQLTILVANRFVVTLEAKNVENIQELKDLADHLELKKLAALAK